jgi:predicted dehydrogenase
MMASHPFLPARWGILGPGRAAGVFASDVRALPGAELVAVASRTEENARAFAAEHRIPRAHGSWVRLAEDPGVDVVYVATPHGLHHAAAAMMLDAGKAVLCEKPMTLDAEQAADLASRARQGGLFLMEGMWTRCLPAIRRMTEMIAAGAIGEPRLLTADFGIPAAPDPRNRLWIPELGGGALLDVGVYLASLARLILGPPTAVAASATLTPAGVDATTTFTLSHADGAQAALACSMVTDSQRAAVISGTEGRIVIPRRFYAATNFELWRGELMVERVHAPSIGHGLAHEVAEVMRCRDAGLTESPLMPLAESVGVLRTLDEVRALIGVHHPVARVTAGEHDTV